MSPVEQFKAAVEHRDAAALRRVLSQHEEARRAINEPLFSFDSPALRHVADGAVALVDVLLEFGADPNRKSGWWAGGFHPLYSANEATAKRLIAAGAIPDACAAAHLDRAELLAQMLKQNPACVHERGGDGQMPLHFARSRRVIDVLLGAGADVDARDIDHRSSAAEWMLGPGRERVSLAKYLVECGATADIFLASALGLADRVQALIDADPSRLNLRTTHGEYGEKAPSSYHIYMWTIGGGMTPLQVAAKFGQKRVLAILQAAATPVQRLLLACHNGDGLEARAIVAAQPDIVRTLGAEDRRALTNEAMTGNPAAVELMLELGFDPSADSSDGPAGGTALHCAAWVGSPRCVGAILKHPSGRALVEARDAAYGSTPLGWCRHGSTNCGNRGANHAEVERLLIAAGATVD